MKAISLKFFVISVFCIICNYTHAQLSLTISEAKETFSKEIIDLDPIEGIYDVQNNVMVYSPDYGNQSTKQHFTWIIIKLDRYWEAEPHEKNDFVVISAEGSVKGFMGIIRKLSQESYYTFKGADARGREKNYRFYLENGVAFELKDQNYNGYASMNKHSTALKSYPTVLMYRDAFSAEAQKNAASSGTGFFLSNDGYIVTNNHVIENAQNGNIKITGINEDYNKSYMARVEVTDKQNDLAILKITDASPIMNVPYTFKFTTSSVGEECFVLGYPLISSMGKNIKLTNGIISSKTGFDGNIAQYQISAPVQPGNSGGPLFDKNGNIIGIVQAKHTQAENAGYAIKASYIRNLVELLPTTVSFPQRNSLNGKTLPQQVELASKSVCLIIVNGK
ncbi:S1C family serine protease [Pseudobutyrivibrio sp.]